MLYRVIISLKDTLNKSIPDLSEGEKRKAWFLFFSQNQSLTSDWFWRHVRVPLRTLFNQSVLKDTLIHQFFGIELCVLQ